MNFLENISFFLFQEVQGIQKDKLIGKITTAFRKFYQSENYIQEIFAEKV